MTYQKIFFLFLISFSNILFSQSVPIAEVRMNNSSGVPIMEGQLVTVAGIVTSSNQFGNNGPGSIQDETGGMSVYGSGFVNQVAIGDSVRITATLTHFNGLTQLDFRIAGASFTKYSSGHEVEPEVVTVSEILNQQWNGFEEFESKLVRINNVSIERSGSFEGGTNYPINDGTGTSELRIDNDVLSIIGTPIPSGKVDVIGIVGQFKYGSPFNIGYQILPRFISDIVDDGKPIILNPVFAADIDVSSFTVYYNTARPGNSHVKFGLTEAIELDSVVIEQDTTVHKVKVSGLTSSTRYYFKAYSTNAVGTSESSLYTVYTASNDTSTGIVNVYFNFSVDTSVAIPGNAANGNVNFEQKLIDRINRATHSIDLALYSFFGMQNIADALIVAKNRGVKVRVVYDNRTTQNSMQALINAGIPVIKRTSGLDGIMHNKFFIFDARDTISTNDWIWTGSWNVTSTEVNWKNNVIEINDPSIAAAYTIEFEEMWGSVTDSPNSAFARFGYLKTDNTPHHFNVGGKDIRVYFSPSDGTNGKILNELYGADRSIYLALYVVTRNDLEGAIRSRFNFGVTDVRGIINDVGTSGSTYNNLKSYAEIYQNTGATLHHKYAVVDASFPEYNSTLITGSHNWSSSAENSNDENTLIIQDLHIANQYLQEFKKRYNEAGGTGTFIVPVSIAENVSISNFNYFLYQNYPNPFNPVTTIRFEIPYEQEVELKLYDMLGREVKNLFSGTVPAGVTAIDFKADDLPSGMYLYRLKADHFITAKKLMLVK